MKLTIEVSTEAASEWANSLAEGIDSARCDSDDEHSQEVLSALQHAFTELAHALAAAAEI